MEMNGTWLVHHEYEDENEDEQIKLIGAYSTEEKAKAAVERVRTQSGFKDHPDGFSVSYIRFDQDHWVEGFIHVTHE